MQWILASASPRRKELLAELITEFDVIPSKADEQADGISSPKALVQKLAFDKAKEVSLRKESEGKNVLGSDTVVAFGEKILGKPKDEREAFEMLSLLSGNVHQVYTGISIFYLDANGERKNVTDVDCTEVQFETLSEREILDYIKTGSPMDKAGAYGIQDGGLVKGIKGSFSNVMGLPLERLQQMLELIKN